LKYDPKSHRKSNATGEIVELTFLRDTFISTALKGLGYDAPPILIFG
jgi:hypothetical protein